MGRGPRGTVSGVAVAKQGWSYLASILPQLGEVPIYNAINFNFGFNADTYGTAEMSTIQNTQVKAFLCPSDPLAGVLTTSPGTNNYYACVGTTSNFNNANTSISSLARPGIADKRPLRVSEHDGALRLHRRHVQHCRRRRGGLRRGGLETRGNSRRSD